MKNLWLLILPFLFLPDLDWIDATAYGEIKVADYVMVIYLLAIFFAWLKLPSGSRGISNSGRILLLFLVWTCSVTVSIPFRFGYNEILPQEMITALLKVGKFLLYTLAGIFTSQVVFRANKVKVFQLSLLVGLSIPTFFFLYYGSPKQYLLEGGISSYAGSGCSAVALYLAMFFCYFLIQVISNKYETRLLRNCVALSCFLMALAVMASFWRGSIVAMICGSFFGLVKSHIKIKYWVGLSFFMAALMILVFASEDFQNRLDQTIHPFQYAVNGRVSNVADKYGIDDGSRLQVWAEEGQRFWDAPIFGAGFYHRDGLSTLPPYSSHNHFLQMFLETGPIGGFLFILLFYQLWIDASKFPEHDLALGIAEKSALVAVIVGSMTETYLYGGLPIFFTLAIIPPHSRINRGYQAVSQESISNQFTVAKNETHILSGDY
ncbi:MAG: O-antigen ligase family protein [Deltaproteobacteria bacterium]|nr:O-antigen ligase family protein [Deltaproteobacteria bacterium]